MAPATNRRSAEAVGHGLLRSRQRSDQDCGNHCLETGQTARIPRKLIIRAAVVKNREQEGKKYCRGQSSTEASPPANAETKSTPEKKPPEYSIPRTQQTISTRTGRMRSSTRPLGFSKGPLGVFFFFLAVGETDRPFKAFVSYLPSGRNQSSIR